MTIIKCPFCIDKTNLAEILPNGDIKIIRIVKESERSWGGEQVIYYTIVRAKEFELICGNCGNSIIYKEFRPTMPQFDIMLGWGTIMAFYEKNSNFRL